MSEVSKDAKFLIDMSWQALQRVEHGQSATPLFERTAVILFATFFIEANLNEIIDRLDMTQKMMSFLRPKGQRYYPGLEAKLNWFYYEFINKDHSLSNSDAFRKQAKAELARRYPRFEALCRFRNDIAHGKINSSARTHEETLQLRKQAKELVNDLFDVIAQKGHLLKRDTTHRDAIT